MMFTTLKRGAGALAIAIATLVPATTLLTASSAGADPPGRCTMGTQVTDGGGKLAMTLSVGNTPRGGTSFTQIALGVFEHGGTKYGVSLCRDTNNNAYNYSISGVNSNSGDIQGLAESDAAKYFTITFTPTSTDIPLTSENHALVSTFSVDSGIANVITLTAQPLAFTDIWGCPNPPAQCAAAPPNGSVHDNPASLAGSVRFLDSTKPAGQNGAAGFDDLPGMTLSSGAYYFFVGASCPTNAMRDQSYSGLKIDLGGPHLKEDGTTQNSALVQAWIPATAIAQCFGADPATYVANAQVTRTESGLTATLTSGSSTTSPTVYNISVTTDASGNATGVLLTVPDATFSVPRYNFTAKKTLFGTSKTFASLAAGLKVAKPAGGHFGVTINRSSKNFCAAGVTKVFGFTKNKTCSFTLKAYKSNRQVQTTKTGSFAIK